MGNESGASKRSKKRKLDAQNLSQKGALDKFIVRNSQVNSENQAPHGNVDDEHDNDTVQVEAHVADTHIVDDPNIGNEGNDTNIADDISNSSHPEIFDARTSDGPEKKMIDILLQKGPKMDLSIEHGRRDKLSRRFSAVSYTRVLSNGEKCDREWLVYSKEPDKVFCFCCK